jgi:large subunit ribosomal protein L29
MKVSEINELSVAELEGKVAELAQELFNLRFQKSISQLQDTARLGKIKRDRARVLTRLNQLKRAV